MATASHLAPALKPTTTWPGSWTRPILQTRRPLDLVRVRRDALLIILLLLVNKPGNLGAAAFFTILVGMVLKSPQAAFKALAICWLGLMMNTAFVPKSIVWTPMRLVLPLIALVRFNFDLLSLRASLLTSPTYIAFLVYIAMMAICSIVSGFFTEIALIKLANYWACVSAILSGVSVLRRMRIDLTEWLTSLISAATVLGIGSIAIGVDNNFRNFVTGTESTSFVGAFLHPNCHSVYASLFIIFLATVLLIGDYSRRWIALPMIAVWLVFIYWSKARSALLATIVGLLVLFVLTRPLKNRFGWRLRVNMRRWKIAVIVILFAILGGMVDLATGGLVSRGFIAFIQKQGNETAGASLDTEKMLESRAGLVELSLKNFRENPLFGIGFQVSTDPRFAQNATLFSAPVEKGVIATAVLEEGGIFGATAFVVFLLVMIGELFRAGNVPALAILSAFLASNLGEMTFFSPGGSGLFGWTMLGAAMILGDHCWRRAAPPFAIRTRA